MTTSFSLPAIIAVASVGSVLVLAIAAGWLLAAARRRRKNMFRSDKEDNDRLARYGGHLSMISIQRNAVVCNKRPPNWLSDVSLKSFVSALKPKLSTNVQQDKKLPEQTKTIQPDGYEAGIPDQIAHLTPLRRNFSRPTGYTTGPRVLPPLPSPEDQPVLKRDSNQVHKERPKAFQTEKIPLGPRDTILQTQQSRFDGVSAGRCGSYHNRPTHVGTPLRPRPSKKQFIGPREMIEESTWISPSPPRDMSAYLQVRESKARTSSGSESASLQSVDTDYQAQCRFPELESGDRMDPAIFEAPGAEYDRPELQSYIPELDPSPFTKDLEQQYYPSDTWDLQQPHHLYSISHNRTDMLNLEYLELPSHLSPRPSTTTISSDAALHPAPLRTPSKVVQRPCPQQADHLCNGLLAPPILIAPTPPPFNHDVRDSGLSYDHPYHSLESLSHQIDRQRYILSLAPSYTPSVYNTHPPPTPQPTEGGHIDPAGLARPEAEPHCPGIPVGALASRLRRMDSACDARSEDGYFDLTRGATNLRARPYTTSDAYMELEPHYEMNEAGMIGDATAEDLDAAREELQAVFATTELLAPRLPAMATAPESVVPERITPDRIAPERITPERIAPERMAPEGNERATARSRRAKAGRDKTPWGKAIASM